MLTGRSTWVYLKSPKRRLNIKGFNKLKFLKAISQSHSSSSIIPGQTIWVYHLDNVLLQSFSFFQWIKYNNYIWSCFWLMDHDWAWWSGRRACEKAHPRSSVLNWSFLKRKKYIYVRSSSSRPWDGTFIVLTWNERHLRLQSGIFQPANLKTPMCSWTWHSGRG